MRKIILIVVLLVVALLMTFLVRECNRKLQSRKLREVATPLPDFTFRKLNGENFTSQNLSSGEPFVIFRMHPECDQCQEEAKVLKKNIELFKGIRVLVLSSAPLEMLEKFAVEHDLVGRENVIILHDPDFKFESWFGEAPYPTAIVYDQNHKLKAHYPGGAKMELILKMLNSD